MRFTLTANGRIEGRVVRSDGAAASRTAVAVVPAVLPPDDGARGFPTWPSATTDEDGRFSIDAILPGRYVIAVNALYGPRLTAPYLTTYYPGASRQDARVVELAEGGRKTGFTIVVSPLEETTVSGTVVFDDDRTAPDADVVAEPVDHRGMPMHGTQTNAAGAFELRLLAGVAYVIRATVRTEKEYRRTEATVFVDERKDGLRLKVGR